MQYAYNLGCNGQGAVSEPPLQQVLLTTRSRGGGAGTRPWDLPSTAVLSEQGDTVSWREQGPLKRIQLGKQGRDVVFDPIPEILTCVRAPLSVCSVYSFVPSVQY